MIQRRAILLGTLGIPFAMQAALAGPHTNARLLLARMSVNKRVIPFDGEFVVNCSLEARESFCRVYMPFRWSDHGGFKLEVTDAHGKVHGPLHYPPSEAPEPASFASASHYRELDVGEKVGFGTVMHGKDIFRAPGKYKLRAVYLPEPTRKYAVGQAIVAENGPVETWAVRVEVV